MKSYTDLEQSKKLAEILPLESADMCWITIDDDQSFNGNWEVVPRNSSLVAIDDKPLFCWSLTALLGVLPKEIVYDKNMVFLEFHAWENSLEYVNNADYTLYVTESYNNPVDACVAMIGKLHEQNLL